MREPRNRVVQVRRFGGPDGLEIIDAPLPTAGRGEVRVRVLASSLEYTDTLIRRHLYPQTAARRPPFVLGYGVVGQIDQLGDGVRYHQRPGSRFRLSTDRHRTPMRNNSDIIRSSPAAGPRFVSIPTRGQREAPEPTRAHVLLARRLV
jgi:NADPH:quinone reductase-like Zn-dependent oxidoreductase